MGEKQTHHREDNDDVMGWTEIGARLDLSKQSAHMIGKDAVRKLWRMSPVCVEFRQRHGLKLWLRNA